MISLAEAFVSPARFLIVISETWAEILGRKFRMLHENEETHGRRFPVGDSGRG